MLAHLKSATAVVFLAMLWGCSPASMVTKVGVKVAGDVISDQNTEKLSSELVGKPAKNADAKLGEPKNVWRDVHGPRQWRTYAVDMDVLGKKRWVAAIERDRVARIEMIEPYGSSMDIPLELNYSAKVNGKSPAEAQAALGLGRPLIAARNESRRLAELYNAKLIEGVKYDVLLFYDEQDRCEKVKLVKMD